MNNFFKDSNIGELTAGLLAPKSKGVLNEFDEIWSSISKPETKYSNSTSNDHSKSSNVILPSQSSNYTSPSKEEENNYLPSIGLDSNLAAITSASKKQNRHNPSVTSTTVRDEIDKNLKPKVIETKRMSNYDIANLLMENFEFAVIENNLHYWNFREGYFVGLVGENADTFIRQNTPTHLKGLITIKSSEEITRWLKSKEQLNVSLESLALRKEYVAFLNCVVKISDLSVNNHSPNFKFTSIVKTEYPHTSNIKGPHFESFIHDITDGDLATYYRLQELFGYVLSEIRDVKVIAFLLGPKDSGKSIILKLLESMIGEDFFTNLSFEEMNQPQLMCHLFGKKLNSCGETSEIPLNRLDNLKKLSGGDYVMARFLYGQAFKFINKAALVFAGNHLPILKGVDKSNAFTERLVIFPFYNQVDKANQDIHLIDKLLLEKSYIARWALLGLRRWCENNYQFTDSDNVNEIVENYSVSKNSVSQFVNDCCIFSPNLRTHNEKLELAYKEYCKENSIVEETNKSFHKIMQGYNDLKYSRFRLDGNNKNGYIGICFKNKDEKTTY